MCGISLRAVPLPAFVVCCSERHCHWLSCRGLSVKSKKGLKDRVVDLIDDIAELLGLQPRFIPVRVKNKSKEKKK